MIEALALLIGGTGFLAVLTAVGALRRHRRTSIAAISGLAFPITWLVWDELDYQEYRVAEPFRTAPSDDQDDQEFGATELDAASNDHMLDAAEVATPSTRSRSQPLQSSLAARS